MGIKQENTVAGSTTKKRLDGYDPTKRINYHTTLALLEFLVESGKLTRKDYKIACAVLNKKYNFQMGVSSPKSLNFNPIYMDIYNNQIMV